MTVKAGTPYEKEIARDLTTHCRVLATLWRVDGLKDGFKSNGAFQLHYLSSRGNQRVLAIGGDWSDQDSESLTHLEMP